MKDPVREAPAELVAPPSDCGLTECQGKPMCARCRHQARMVPQPDEPVARCEETSVGPRLWVYGVRVHSWLGCVHDAEVRKLAEAINAAAPPAPQPAGRALTRDAVIDLVRECGLDWHRGFSPLFDGDDTNRYEVLVRAALRAHGIKSEGE